MKLNAGIITEKLQETKDFYVNKLGFGVTFENEWYILLHTPGKGEEIAFLKPGLPAQAPIFRKAFTGSGVFLTIEMDGIDGWYKTVKEKGVKIEVEIKDEDWGDRHFAVVDPNGVGIDFVNYQEPD